MIYLAIPYTHPNEDVRVHRYQICTMFSGLAAKHGVSMFSPITQSHAQSELVENLPTGFEFWRNTDLDILSRCAGIWVLTVKGWKESHGVREEIKEAERLGLPITYVKLGGETMQDVREWWELFHGNTA